MLLKIQVYSPHESICACIAVPVAVVTTSDVIKMLHCACAIHHNIKHDYIYFRL